MNLVTYWSSSFHSHMAKEESKSFHELGNSKLQQWPTIANALNIYKLQQWPTIATALNIYKISLMI